MHEFIKPALKGTKLIATAGDTGEPRFWAMVAVIAFFSGASRAVLGRNEKTRWYDIVAAAVISSISGLSVAMLGLAWLGQEKQLLVMAMVGPAGWMGVVLMDVVGGAALKVVQKRTASLEEQHAVDDLAGRLTRRIEK